MGKAKTIDYQMRYDLRVRARDAWTYLSDTSKLYRAALMPARQISEQNGKLVVDQKLFFFLKERWIEEPWSWVVGKSVELRRAYVYGMAKSLRALFEVEETSSDSCRVTLNFNWEPNGFFWRLVLLSSIPIQRIVARRVFTKIERHVIEAGEAGDKFEALQSDNKTLAPGGFARLAKIGNELLEMGLSRDAIEKVSQLIVKGDELDVYRLQVKPLAKKWNVSQRDLVSVCLHGTRMGLFSISWDVICPHCRGVRFEAANLGSIPVSGNCEVCEIDFKTDRLDAIEITFHIHPSIREVKKVEFCAAEASKKEHIKVQQVLPAGREITVRPLLDEGHHRFRVKGRQSGPSLLVTNESESNEITWSGEARSDEMKCGSRPALRFKNDSAEEVIFVVEDQRWRNVALLPAEVFLFQEFHDLFSEEHLQVDVKLSLGERTVLFTDIVGSTKFYQTVGDGKAFRTVKNHFNEVFAVVNGHGGCVVKTIGDSVMAAFNDSKDGLAAAVAIQKLFHVNREDTPVRLRISLHSGPVIAVHVSQGVDFFGGTVNLAAKLQGCAEAHEIAISNQLFDEVGSRFGQYRRETRTLKMRYTDEALEAVVLQIDTSKPQQRTA